MKRSAISFSIFLLLGLSSGAISVFAATSIGTDVNTAGNISASGTITAGSDITTSGDLNVGGQLTVVGALKFQSGANNDYILSSDNSGNAIWIPVSMALNNASTDDLPEGGTNLYYTDGRVDTEVGNLSGAPDGIAPLDSSGTVPLSNLPVGVPGGLATLDGSGKIFVSQLPSLVISNSYVVGSQSAMLALSANVGDIAIRTDEQKSYILSALPASTLSNWLELLSPSSGVTSFNGRVGTVSPQAGDYAKSDITGLGDADSPTFAGLTLTSGLSVGSGAVSINGVNYSFPSATGTAGQVLTATNASGTLAWTAVLTNAITSLNGLTTSTQTFATGSSGTDFNIVSSTSTHTFNIPTASTSARGLLAPADFTTFNNKLSTTTAAATYVPFAYASSTFAAGTGTAKTLTYWSGTNTVSTIPSGAPGTFLTPSSTSPNGFDWVSTSAASVSWGVITGLLSDQTDLQNALDAKLSTTSAASTYVPYSGASSSVDLGAHGLTADTIQFNASNTAADGVGVLRWNDTDGTLNLGMKGGNVSLQIGEEMVVRVKNNTGSSIVDGQVVYVSGSDGDVPEISLAKADNAATALTAFGVATEPIPTGSEGFVTVAGFVHDLDTSAFNEGDILWLSATTPGAFTNVPPVAPNFGVRVGYVITKSPTAGVIGVKLQPGFNLGNLGNVLVPSPSDNDVLMYDASSSLWKNATITGYVSFGYASSTFPTFDYASSTFAAGTGATNTIAFWDSLHGISTIPTGLPGQFLRASSTSPTGFDWSATSAAAVSWGVITGTLTDQTDLAAALNAKLAATTAAATYVAGAGNGATNTLAIWTSSKSVTTLATGTPGTFLRASSTSPTGFDWAAGNSGTVTSVDVSGSSTGLTFTGGPVSTSGTLTLGGILNVANGGTGANSTTSAFNNLSPLTTKGDVLAYGSSNTRLPVGSDGQFLMASSATATGLAWTTIGGGTVSSVNASGGTTGLSFTGGPVSTSGTLTLGGTLNVANGGTGATTSGAYTVFGNGGNSSAAPTFMTMTSVNRQTGAGYTALTTDWGKLVSVSNATAQTLTLPSTAPASGWFIYVQNTGTGTWAVSRNGLTIDGGTTNPSLATGQGIAIWSDGSNYFTSRGSGAIANSTLTSGQLVVGAGGGTLSVGNLSGDVVTSGGTNTTVGKVNGVAYSSAPATNTVPVVTSGGTGGSITYEAVPIVAGGTGQTSKTNAFDALSPLSATGSLIAYNGTDNIALSAGSAGQFLSVSSTAATGLAWTSGNAGSVTSVAASGGTTGLSFTGSPISTSGTLTLGGTLNVANGGTGAAATTTAFNNLSPLTTKGDVHTFDGTNNVRLAVGTNGQILMASSTAATGLAWTSTSSLGFAASQWTSSSSDIYYNSGNVSIGTSSATAPLTVGGNVNVVGLGSSTSSPRIVGITPWNTGNAAQFYFGDPSNIWQNAYGDRMQLSSYWGMEIRGTTQGATTSFITGLATDPALNVIGTTNGAPVLAVTGSGGQTANLEQWQNSAAAILAEITSSGNLALGTATTAPTQLLDVGGNERLRGALFDATNASGTSGQILQSTGTSTQWVSTTSLGLGGGSSQWTSTGSNLYYLAGSVAVGTTTFGSTGNIPFTIATSGGAADALDVYNTNEGAKNAFSIFTDLSTTVNNGKAFNIQVPGESLARVEFYSDGKFGIGPGATTRDTFLSRSATSTFTISSDGGTGAAALRLTGAFFDGINASGTAGMVLTSVGTSTRWVSTSTAIGTLAIANGGTGQTAAVAAFNGLSPITTKGDLISNDGTNDVRLPVGTAGQHLTASTTAATGLAWQTVNGSVMSFAAGQNGGFTLSCSTATGGAANYFGQISGNNFSSGDTNAGIVPIVVPGNYSLSNMYVSIPDTAVPAGETATFYLDSTNATTTLTCAVAAGGHTCSDTTHSQTVAAGATLNMKVYCSGGTTGIAGPFAVSFQAM